MEAEERARGASCLKESGKRCRPDDKASQTRVLVNLESKSHLKIVLFSFLVSHHAVQTLKLNEMFSSTVCFSLPKTLWCLSFNGLETSVCSVVVEYYSCSFQKFKQVKIRIHDASFSMIQI